MLAQMLCLRLVFDPFRNQFNIQSLPQRDNNIDGGGEGF
ncbi:hypothetical protein LTSEWAN_2206, partial [Salmonella enterica subsp. enterica serovar Wandsworth str. A4-580]